MSDSDQDKPAEESTNQQPPESATPPETPAPDPVATPAPESSTPEDAPSQLPVKKPAKEKKPLVPPSLINPLTVSWFIFGCAVLAIAVWFFRKPKIITPDITSASKIELKSLPIQTQLIEKPPAAEDSWAFNKVIPATDNAAPQQVALIITDVGVNLPLMNQMMEKLPKTVGLAFNPYVKDLPKHMEKAKSMGFPVLMGLPFEPYDLTKIDPGPLCLMADLDRDQNLYRLHVLISQVQDPNKPGYSLIEGVVSTYGNRLNTSYKDLVPVLRHLKVLGLYFIEGVSTIFSEVPTVCKQEKLSCKIVDYHLDAHTLIHGEDGLQDLIQRPGGVVFQLSASDLNPWTLSKLIEQIEVVKAMPVKLISPKDFFESPKPQEE